MTEDEMVRWHYPLNGHEFEQALGVGDGEGSLVCCSPWGHRVGYDLSTKPPEYKCANLQRRYIKKGLLFPSKEDLAHFQLRILG